MSGPHDGAYGRVRNPERYRVVHEAAASLIEALVASFDSDLADGLDADPFLTTDAAGVVIERLVRVTPRAVDAAPVSFAFTSFPAVLVHAGQWRIRAYPGCGCDACDEAPEAAVDQLRQDIDALTAGRVTEEWDGTRRLSAIEYADGSSSSGWALVEQDRDSYGEPRRYDWYPWPLRDP